MVIDCINKCPNGFVELLEENWGWYSIIDKYGYLPFLNEKSIDTTAIRNILEIEGYKKKEFKKLFHDMILFTTTIISIINEVHNNGK